MVWCWETETHLGWWWLWSLCGHTELWCDSCGPAVTVVQQRLTDSHCRGHHRCRVCPLSQPPQPLSTSLYFSPPHLTSRPHQSPPPGPGAEQSRAGGAGGGGGLFMLECEVRVKMSLWLITFLSLTFSSSVNHLYANSWEILRGLM